MPYIEKFKRNHICYVDHEMNQRVVVPGHIENAGDLQYAIAVIIKEYLETNELRYQTCNDIMGALAGAQMEFYRRTVAPYEDQKIKINGDV